MSNPLERQQQQLKTVEPINNNAPLETEAGVEVNKESTQMSTNDEERERFFKKFESEEIRKVSFGETAALVREDQLESGNTIDLSEPIQRAKLQQELDQKTESITVGSDHPEGRAERRKRLKEAEQQAGKQKTEKHDAEKQKSENEKVEKPKAKKPKAEKPKAEKTNSQSPDHLASQEAEKANSREALRKKEQEATKKLRVRVFPIWLRLVVILVLCIVALIGGAMIGYGIIGKGNPMDVFHAKTWTHIRDIIYLKK